MYRCAQPALPRRRPLMALAASLALSAPLLGLVATIATPLDAQAQIVPGHRYFPQRALRGELIVGVAPDVTLNGKAARLAPGSRIRDAVDMLATPGALYNQKLTVLYTTDMNGLIMDVWVLNAVELANKTWPTSAEQAAKLVFDQPSQVWRKP